MTKDEAMQQALEALIDAANVLSAPMFADAVDALKAALEQPVQEPVVCRFCHDKRGCWTWQCYKCGEIDDVQKPAPLPEQEPPQYSFKAHWTDDKRIGVVACVTRPDGGVHLMQTIIDLPPEQVLLEGSNPYLPALAVTALREALAQPEQKPVAYDYHTKYDRGCYKCRSQFCPGNCVYTAAPLPVQPEPVTWDKPSASFDEWWDGDRRRDNANPFTTDSFSYWAFEGWQAALAQRPWQGLTEEEIAVIGDKVANEDLVGLVSNFRVRLARAIEQTLKEKNHG